MTPEEQAAADKAVADAKAAEESKKVVFDEKQQEAINKLIESRLTRNNAKHEEDKEKLRKELEAAKKAADSKGEGADNNDTPEKKQARELIDAEKARTKQAREDAAKKGDEAKALKEENARILKNQAIRDAVGDRFVDLEAVMAMTASKIEFDPETKQYVVRENGLIRQNSSLEPMTLDEYFTDFGQKRPYFVKSNARGGAGSSGDSGGGRGAEMGVVNSKADLKTIKQKTEYIDKFGLEAWEKLPLKVQ